jgi:hypothetical protein
MVGSAVVFGSHSRATLPQTGLHPVNHLHFWLSIDSKKLYLSVVCSGVADFIDFTVTKECDVKFSQFDAILDMDSLKYR